VATAIRLRMIRRVGYSTTHVAAETRVGRAHLR